MGKKNQDPDLGSGSGMNNPDHIFESLETIFWVKVIKFFDEDPGWKKFGSGMREQHCVYANCIFMYVTKRNFLAGRERRFIFLFSLLLGYLNREREYISELVRHLGAEPQDLLAKRENKDKAVRATSHLICPLPEGAKYEAALKWGIPVVTKVCGGGEGELPTLATTVRGSQVRGSS